jgi:chaperonin GroES
MLNKNPMSKLPIPLQDRVLISQNKPEEKTSGGIIIPSQAIEESNRGFIVAAGPTVKESRLTPGTEVLFGSFTGQEIKTGTETYLIMKETDILVIL